MFNIVLLEPEIPQNTGNIGRSCVAAGAALLLIRPLGFFLGEKNIRRAGLDYWHMATTKAERTYCDVRYEDGCYIMFGKESAGIPEEILKENRERCVRIPMLEGKRSLNLSNSASIILYEALRQNGFKGLQEGGKLHRLSWDS